MRFLDLLLIALLVIILAATCIPISGRVDERKGICTSAACIKRSAAMIFAMDQSVDPCEDFYQYACGRWNNSFADLPAMDEFEYSNSFDRLEIERHDELHKILEQPTKFLQSKTEKYTQLYYQSCVQIENMKHTDTQSRKALLQLLDLIGGWKVIREISDESFLRKPFDFQEAFETAHNFLHAEGFFRWEVEWDNNLGKHMIVVFPTEMPKYEVHNDHHRINISELNYKVNEVVSFLLSSDSSTLTGRKQFLLSEALGDIIDVEARLLSLRPVLDDDEYLTIADLQTSAPFINWNKFFQSAFSQVSIAVTPSTIVTVSSLPYLRNLSILVGDLLSNDRNQIKLKNYLSWRIAKFYFAKLKKRWNPNRRVNDIWNDCISDTVNRMDFAISAMFLRQRADSKSKMDLAYNMAKAIKESFKENLNNLDWLDDETRLGVGEKVDAMDILTGYPDFILNSTTLDKFYEGLEIKPNEYIMNNVRLDEFFFRKKLLKLDQVIDKSEWRVSPISFAISYYSNLNQVVLPGGILYEPFFDVTFPPSINFGSIGLFLGHEIAHGFDSNGLRNDREGNTRQWLKKEIIQLIAKHSQCFVKQYSNYSTHGHYVPTLFTKNENIADYLGLRTSFTAFSSWEKITAGGFLPLPGLILTQQQLFFLSFAQSLCSKGENDVNMFDDHSPERYRVIGSLSNMPEFSTAFQCPTDSFMNPRGKCRIW